MSRMSGFIFQDRYITRLENLTDQEVGRLVRALAMYHATGETPELNGREQGAYDFIRADIDEAEAAHEGKCQTNRRNGGKRMQANGSECKRTVANASERQQPYAVASDSYQNNIAVTAETEKERTEEGYPFGLTDKEIQASLERDRQIEECARYMGLETTMAALDDAREMAQQYGLDNLLSAMREAVDIHTWRYVKGILKKGGASAKQEQKQVTPARGDDEIRWFENGKLVRE